MGINQKTGFTLAELLIAAIVFIPAVSGILISYINCLELSDQSKTFSLAVHGVKSRFEEIKNTSFSQIKANYNNVTFTAANLNGIGVSYVDDANPILLKVTVTFCWKQGNGRVLGEDKNLNGQLNTGEDQNGNGLLDSPAQLVSYIAQ